MSSTMKIKMENNCGIDAEATSLIVGAIVTLITVLFPTVNRKLDKVTSSNYAQIGFDVVRALEKRKVDRGKVNYPPP